MMTDKKFDACSPLAFLFGSEEPRAVIVTGQVVASEDEFCLADARALLSLPRVHKLLYIPAALFWSRAALHALGAAGFSSGAVQLSGVQLSGVVAPLGLPSLASSVPVISTLLFMLSLRSLNSHKSSKRGNLLGMGGAALAVGSLLYAVPINTALFLPTALAASVIGVAVANQVSMEQMPELVASFHSLTGLAAVLVSVASVFPNGATSVHAHAHGALLETFLGASVGSLTFTASVTAALKLAGVVSGAPQGERLRNVLVPAGVLGLGGLAFWFASAGAGATAVSSLTPLLVNVVVSGVLGVAAVMPIGGSDMPIVVSLLNSLTGVATAASGFMLHDTVLVMAGGLIASSGALLSDIMCRGMNRSLLSVLVGGFGVGSAEGSASAEAVAAGAAGGEGSSLREVQAESLATQLASEGVRRVLIVPGYGMAVARCQGVLAEIVRVLRAARKSVEFGIHPVAGRLPGHMNVLLAEADVPYDIVHELEEVNKRMHEFDVAIVLGANDTVNPGTQDDPASAIYGMPAIEVWRAKQVVVMKRSMATGYAGVQNPLFFKHNARMLFGDAKATLDVLFKRLLELQPCPHGLSTQAEAADDIPSDWRASRPDRDEEDDLLPSAEDQDADATSPRKTVGVVKEWREVKEGEAGERRVTLSPRVVGKLRRLQFAVVVERGAGEAAGWSDADYVQQGARLCGSREEVVRTADVILKLQMDSSCAESKREHPEQTEKIFLALSVSAAQLSSLQLSRQLAQLRLTVFNLALVPRISRAQKLDTLSSMANIAGYRAVLEAFHLLPRFSRTSVTAGGTIAPARVFVIGAGVAGLSAIATAKALGCSVVANDVRPACKDQVESMGAVFVEIPDTSVSVSGSHAGEMSAAFLARQKAVYRELVEKADVVICTAMIPGKRAPVLIDEETVRRMARDAVIVDMAAAGGGNCALTRLDQTVVLDHNHVRIIGRTDFTSDMPQQASDLLAHNFLAFLTLMGSGRNFHLDLDDPIIRHCLVTHDGQVALPPPPLQTPPPKISAPAIASGGAAGSMVSLRPATSLGDSLGVSTEELAVALGVAALVTLGLTTDAKHVKLMGDFVLSVLVGNFTVASVAPALHTPLISVTNAISGIIVLGGMMQLPAGPVSPKVATALVSVFFSLINVSGGFAISQRMLDMFKADNSRPHV